MVDLEHLSRVLLVEVGRTMTWGSPCLPCRAIRRRLPLPRRAACCHLDGARRRAARLLGRRRRAARLHRRQRPRPCHLAPRQRRRRRAPRQRPDDARVHLRRLPRFAAGGANGRRRRRRPLALTLRLPPRLPHWLRPRVPRRVARGRSRRCRPARRRGGRAPRCRGPCWASRGRLQSIASSARSSPTRVRSSASVKPSLRRFIRLMRASRSSRAVAPLRRSSCSLPPSRRRWAHALASARRSSVILRGKMRSPRPIEVALNTAGEGGCGGQQCVVGQVCRGLARRASWAWRGCGAGTAGCGVAVSARFVRKSRRRYARGSSLYDGWLPSSAQRAHQSDTS
jgi:hypothetical protein